MAFLLVFSPIFPDVQMQRHIGPSALRRLTTFSLFSAQLRSAFMMVAFAGEALKVSALVTVSRHVFALPV
jgi:hypothetical protein